MLILFILATGIIIGILPRLLGIEKSLRISNIAVGVVGAFAGAMLGFGDAPILLKNSFINEITLMVAVSILFVLVKVLLTRSRSTP